MANSFRAHIFKQRNVGEREEVRIKFFNADGSPADLGGGGGGEPSGPVLDAGAMHFRADWVSGEDYKANDVVFEGDKVHIAIQDINNSTDTPTEAGFPFWVPFPSSSSDTGGADELTDVTPQFGSHAGTPLTPKGRIGPTGGSQVLEVLSSDPPLYSNATWPGAAYQFDVEGPGTVAFHFADSLTWDMRIVSATGEVEYSSPGQNPSYVVPGDLSVGRHYLFIGAPSSETPWHPAVTTTGPVTAPAV